MKFIKEITDKEVTGEDIEFPENFSERKAARSILIDSGNKIAILNMGKFNCHKLPGGGVENKENIIETLKRELLEETGCTIKSIKEFGKIVEKKAKSLQKQESYVYQCRVFEKKNKPNFTEDELNMGFALIWLDLDKAIETIERDNPLEYNLKFIKLRDLTILKEFSKNLISEKF